MTCHPRAENYGHRTPPGPCVPHGGTPEAPQYPLTPWGWHALRAGVWHCRRRVVAPVAPQYPLTPLGGTLSWQGYGFVVAVSCRRVVAPVAPVPNCVAPAKSPPVPAYNVPAGHSHWSLRVSDAGGSRRSYRNGRGSLCRGRGHPLPQDPRAPKVVGGGDAWLEPGAQRA